MPDSMDESTRVKATREQLCSLGLNHIHPFIWQWENGIETPSGRFCALSQDLARLDRKRKGKKHYPTRTGSSKSDPEAKIGPSMKDGFDVILAYKPEQRGGSRTFGFGGGRRAAPELRLGRVVVRLPKHVSVDGQGPKGCERERKTGADKQRTRPNDVTDSGYQLKQGGVEQTLRQRCDVR